MFARYPRTVCADAVTLHGPAKRTRGDAAAAGPRGCRADRGPCASTVDYRGGGLASGSIYFIFMSVALFMKKLNVKKHQREQDRVRDASSRPELPLRRPSPEEAAAGEKGHRVVAAAI